MATCCAVFRRELKSPMFDLAEHSPPKSSTNDVASASETNNTRTLHIEKTLSPRPRLPYIGAKLFVAAWIVSILAMSIIKKTHRSFWLAYLTHWGYLFVTAYALMSVFSAVYLALRPPENPSVLEGGVGVLFKTTWVLLAVAVPAEIVITILYWVLLFDGNVVYVDVMMHGGAMILIILDGFFLSRLPLRAKQFIFVEIFSICYLLWTVIHAYSGIGNPYKDDGSQDDDAIYDSLAWKNDTVKALRLSLMLVFVANPIIYLLCRLVSRLPTKRLCEDCEGQQLFKGPSTENNVGDEETPEGNEAVVY